MSGLNEFVSCGNEAADLNVVYGPEKISKRAGDGNTSGVCGGDMLV